MFCVLFLGFISKWRKPAGAVSRDKKDDLHSAHVGKAGWVGRLSVFLRAGKTYDSGPGDLPHN